jgi:hypothetical protein
MSRLVVSGGESVPIGQAGSFEAPFAFTYQFTERRPHTLGDARVRLGGGRTALFGTAYQPSASRLSLILERSSGRLLVIVSSVGGFVGPLALLMSQCRLVGESE